MELGQAVPDEAVARGEAAPSPARWRPLAAALLLTAGPGAALALAIDRFGFPGLAATATGLALLLFAAGRRRFARSRGARGQVLLCAAVVLVPLAAHGLARTFGLGSPFSGGPATVLDWLAGPWFPVQAAAALAAALALRAYRIPFLAWPLATVAWFAAQDAVPLLFGRDPTWTARALVSALSGLGLLAAGLAVDRRTRGDVAFWLYLPGLLALGGGLLTRTGASPLSLAVFALLHAGLVLASLLLGRRSFAVAGALGLAATSGRLADELLDPTARPFALAGVALAVLGLGLLYHLHRARLEALLVARLPRTVVRLLPPHRR